MFAAISLRLSPGVCRRIKQELSNSTQNENEFVEELIIEALRARDRQATLRAELAQRSGKGAEWQM